MPIRSHKLELKYYGQTSSRAHFGTPKNFSGFDKRNDICYSIYEREVIYG